MLSLFKEHLIGYDWIPVVAFSLVIFIASIGILPLQFVILVEVLPKKVSHFNTKVDCSESIKFCEPSFQIRNAASSLCTSLLWIMAFLLTQYYPMMAAALGVHGCMFFFATICFLGALFIIVVVPETKGKSYAEILTALEK